MGVLNVIVSLRLGMQTAACRSSSLLIFLVLLFFFLGVYFLWSFFHFYVWRKALKHFPFWSDLICKYDHLKGFSLFEGVLKGFGVFISIRPSPREKLSSGTLTLVIDLEWSGGYWWCHFLVSWTCSEQKRRRTSKTSLCCSLKPPDVNVKPFSTWVIWFVFCCEQRKRRTGNCSAAAQPELQRVPRFYLTEAIITVIVEMKAQFSEAR